MFGAAFFAVTSGEIAWVDKTHVLLGTAASGVFFLFWKNAPP